MHQQKFELARHLTSVTLALTWFRFLEFLSIDARLNHVTETGKLAGADLFSLSIITFV
eukprot:gene4492-3334_t